MFSVVSSASAQAATVRAISDIRYEYR